ncbi:MAG: YkgJ family cysteine cluster protein [Reyranella sp.]|uniref:YkgJ family cysteine cluster protein n=1 Tax=Reyranella sp. TaxID=1929291 RepID=UPI00272FA613|nr:YkgJ family cysteine cluster protein [Reyranella sp.]MDP1966765.1 YkgJ family cysteine cluster protein [Reyranella sp.]MDP2372199.1 YkgJ family cysteine cluster protein [Reyranella sp.]
MSPAEENQATLQLVAGDPAREALVVGRVVIVLGEEPVTLELGVPPGPVAFEDVLPILHGLTDFVVGRGVAAAETEGRTVSCRAGCGACCRQLVPISQAEARALAALVAAMPAPRRDAVLRRFDEALQVLHAAGIVAEIDAVRHDDGGAPRDLGMRYFNQGVACPFLEDEACSIHPDRPLSCRQYLVTSPAAHCASPSPTTIEMVALPARPSQALMLADCEDAVTTWLPLIYAPGYAAEIPAPARARTAPDILRDVFSRLEK